MKNILGLDMFDREDSEVLSSTQEQNLELNILHDILEASAFYSSSFVERNEDGSLANTCTEYILSPLGLGESFPCAFYITMKNCDVIVIHFAKRDIQYLRDKIFEISLLAPHAIKEIIVDDRINWDFTVITVHYQRTAAL